MSVELKLEHVCAHLVVDEVASLESDLVTVKTLRPIANNSVELKINGFLVEDVTNTDYGFKLVRDATSVDPTARKVQFRSLRKSFNEFYQITYYTRASECRRCHGLRIEQDYRFDNGALVLVRNEKKLAQDVRKIVLTQLGSNRFNKWYGTSIPLLIGSKISNAGFIRSKIESDIKTALKRYADTQRLMESALPGSVDPRERFGRLIQLEVKQDEIEPTAFHIDIILTTQASELVTVNTTVSVPDPVSLAYNTPSSGVISSG